MVHADVKNTEYSSAVKLTAYYRPKENSTEYCQLKEQVAKVYIMILENAGICKAFWKEIIK